MTLNECERLLASMMGIYRQHFPKPDEAIRSMRNIWQVVFEGYSYEEASTGLKWFARMDTKGFPPVPGQIIDCIHKAKEAAGDSYMSEAEAWEYCYRAICDSNYHAEEQFDALPSIVQEAVGSAGALRQMAIEENVNVTKSVFLNTYRDVVRRRKAEGTAPKEVRDVIVRQRGGGEGERPIAVGHILINGVETPIRYGRDGWETADASEVVMMT